MSAACSGVSATTRCTNAPGVWTSLGSRSPGSTSSSTSAIVADFGLVRAWKGDRHGNLVFRDSARNFNPLAAMCGRVTIAEVEQLVEPGEIDPNQVHTPGAFVQRVVALTPEQAADKRIEKKTVRPRTEI